MSDGATNEFEDDLPLVGYLATVSAILRHEGREAWAENISRAASKINEMQKDIEKYKAIASKAIQEQIDVRRDVR